MENPHPIPLFDPPYVPDDDEPLYAALTVPTMMHGHYQSQVWAEPGTIVRIRSLGPKLIRIRLDGPREYQAWVEPSRLDIP
jgi:hypothetical protein